MKKFENMSIDVVEILFFLAFLMLGITIFNEWFIPQIEYLKFDLTKYYAASVSLLVLIIAICLLLTRAIWKYIERFQVEAGW